MEDKETARDSEDTKSPEKSKKYDSAILAFTLGIFAIVLDAIPYTFWITMPAAIVAIFLGVMSRKKTKNKIYATMAIWLGIFLLFTKFIGLILLIAFGGGVS